MSYGLTLAHRRSSQAQQTFSTSQARRARGENPATIAKALGVSRASVYRHLGAESREA